MTTNRLNCCVFGCRKGTSRHPEYREWICAEHWRTIPRPTRKRHLDIQKSIRSDPGLALICRVEADRAWKSCFEAAMQAFL